MHRMDSLKSELLKADVSFSQFSVQQGRNAAFSEFADSTAVMLRKFSMPVVGKESIVTIFQNHPDSAYELSWVPLYAGVARSGDLGYTYGIYSLHSKLNSGEITGSKNPGGTYCTIWKYDRGSQQWKFILGTGNQGLSMTEDE